MKTFLLLALASFPLWSQTYTMSGDALNASQLGFISHQGPGAFDTYLTMEVPYTPVKSLYKELSNRSNLPLITRGEAHITVITPPEYYGELKAYITMDEIDQIAKEMNIQKSQFNVKCLGSGALAIDGKEEKTFYIVVESQDLLNIRQRILDTIQARGGSPVLFKPERFFPHITVGFTKRDLHESDGIFKDVRTCVEKIDID